MWLQWFVSSYSLHGSVFLHVTINWCHLNVLISIAVQLINCILNIINKLNNISYSLNINKFGYTFSSALLLAERCIPIGRTHAVVPTMSGHPHTNCDLQFTYIALGNLKPVTVIAACTDFIIARFRLVQRSSVSGAASCIPGPSLNRKVFATSSFDICNHPCTKDFSPPSLFPDIRLCRF